MRSLTRSGPPLQDGAERGHTFELPSRYRQLERVTIQYASWDLSQVVLCDERNGTVLWVRRKYL
jgi:hypothetical protein